MEPGPDGSEMTFGDTPDLLSSACAGRGSISATPKPAAIVNACGNHLGRRQVRGSLAPLDIAPSLPERIVVQGQLRVYQKKWMWNSTSVKFSTSTSLWPSLFSTATYRVHSDVATLYSSNASIL